MTEAEYMRWLEFYRAYPFDDLHRFHRPHALLAKVMGGGEVDGYIDWLQPPPDDGLTSADKDLFKAGGVTRRVVKKRGKSK